MLRYILVVLAVVMIPSLALARTWTSSDGKEIEGDFVDATAEKVTLKKSDGKVFTFNLDRLSAKDQQFIRGLLARRATKKTTLTEDSDNPFEPASASEPKPGKTEDPLAETSEPVPGIGKMRDVNETKKKLKIENREWTDARGNSTSGKFIRIQGNSVVVLRGGRQTNLDYWKLSQADQSYLQELCEANGLGHMIPKIDPATVAAARNAAGSAPGVLPGGNALPPSAFSTPMNPGTTTTNPGFSTPAAQPVTPAPTETVDPEELARRLRELQNNPISTPSYTPPATATTTPGTSYTPPPSTYSPPPGTSYTPPTSSSYPSTTYPMPGTSYSPSPMSTIPTPTFNVPEMPIPSVPTYAPPTMDFGQKQCENCGKVLSANFTAGDKCPGCGIYFSHDSTNGKTANVRWGGGGGSNRGVIKGIIVLVVLAIKAVAFMAWRSQQS